MSYHVGRRVFAVKHEILQGAIYLPISQVGRPLILDCRRGADQGHTYGSVIEAKRKSTLSAALQVPFLTTWDMA